MKKSTNEPIDIESIFDKKYPILTTEGEDGGLETTVYITNEIGEPHEFVELLSLMGAAEERDQITFVYNTPGGRLDSTIMFLDAASKCKAVLLGEVVGEVASAGTMWLMAMDQITVAKWGSLMIHNYSGGVYGKGGELKARMAFETPFLEAYARDIYRPFLTKAECETVINDNDIYMGREEILERWEKVISRRQKQVDKKLKAYHEEVKEAELSMAIEILDKYGEGSED